MKKTSLALLFGLVLSGSAIAADTGSDVENNTVVPNTTAGCSLLSEPVTLNISNGVAAAYACNPETNVIGVAACHPNGRKSVTFDCDPTLQSGTAGFVEGCSAQTSTFTADEGVAYTASTSGGRVTGVAAQNCTGAGASTVTEAQTAAAVEPPTPD